MPFPDDVLAGHWGLTGADVRPHHGGMNSATWFVGHGGRRFVAKAAGGWFPGGIAVADALARCGFPSGAPVRTLDGRLTVQVGQDERLALLTFVPGAPADDPATIGATLAEVHRLLRGVTVDGEVGMDWVDPDAPHLNLRPWLRDAVAGAVRDLAAAGPLTEGLLHADPAPEAFIGGGLIDWGVAMRGPLLYDVASALMYLGGDGAALLAAYRTAGLIPAAELRTALPVLRRFRYAVQADYFARRLATGDLTGIAGAEDNERGLEDARRALHR
ncbi:phosphotransferase [Dactylosporangium aurantiacum]|uniref:Phosphotransferase n=1 Tax=Dactylosporangium aurantiacum TaxID=35754 RepID=A0A9Q9IP88_9ACTN|nr:phosphotransferase [Dactylosporangium aurantiacum]MDG6108440.1 phosphotransferase [Dactylosporangium aurantiacum]UWZ57367.1 phosphotransferase [Dactylosporangium aurantiacum]